MKVGRLQRCHADQYRYLDRISSAAAGRIEPKCAVVGLENALTASHHHRHMVGNKNYRQRTASRQPAAETWIVSVP